MVGFLSKTQAHPAVVEPDFEELTGEEDGDTEALTDEVEDEEWESYEADTFDEEDDEGETPPVLKAINPEEDELADDEEWEYEEVDEEEADEDDEYEYVYE